ncbi:MAG: hypothetical protein ACRDP6_40710 [Actinoallomurus sp.]
MSMWRCPHCGTPQPESARCWVCHRSSTTCSTCRNFRRGVAGQLGYCGLDRRRLPLAGTELRGCWERAAARVSEAPAKSAATATSAAADPGTRLRDFVPVELRRDRRIVVGGRRDEHEAAIDDVATGATAATRSGRSPLSGSGASGGATGGATIPAATFDVERVGTRLTLFGEVDQTGS